MITPSPASIHDFGDELVRPSHWLSCHGFWSGTQGRHHKRFIAIIPLSRYVELDRRLVPWVIHESQAQNRSLVNINNSRFKKEAHNFTEPEAAA